MLRVESPSKQEKGYTVLSLPSGADGLQHGVQLSGLQTERKGGTSPTSVSVRAWVYSASYPSATPCSPQLWVPMEVNYLSR